MSELTIDQEFQNLIPALRPEEFVELEANIKADGCRDPLVVWLCGDEQILLDGHNRYAICEKHGIQFDVHRLTEDEIPDRDAAMDWMDRNQLGRRNLTKQQFTKILGRRYNRLKKKHGNEGGDKDRRKRLKGQNDPLKSTADQIAKEHGVSPRTVKRAGKHAEDLDKLKAVDPDIEAKSDSSAVSCKAVNDAARVVDSDPNKAKKILADDATKKKQRAIQREEDTYLRNQQQANQGASLPKKKDEPKQDNRSAVGLRRAHEAIGCLKRIPNTDKFRDDAFDTVIEWIKFNR